MRLKFQRPPPRDFVDPIDDVRPPIRAPFTVLIDTREQAPYTFQGIRGDAPEANRLLRVRRKWCALKSGDYSVEGYSGQVAIERKSLTDLFGSLGKGRERFTREMDRLSRFDFAALVVEAEWSRILLGHKRSRLPPKSVIRTCFAWTQRFGVPWFCVPGRRAAELTTYRLLERWWRDYREAIAEASEYCRYCGRPLTDPRSVDCGMGPWCRRVKESER